MIKSAFMNLQGMRIHYLECGEGKPLVLLHGGGADSARLSWGLFLPEFSQAARLLAPEMPGYGDSERPIIQHSTELYVGLVRDFLDTLGIEKASLMGISMGGAISLGFTLSYPERVDDLVLVDSYGLQERAPFHRLSYLVVKMRRLQRASWRFLSLNRGMARWSLASIFHRAQRITHDLLEEMWQEIRKPGTGEAFMEYQAVEISWKGTRTYYLPRLGEVKARTLILHGEKDSLVPLACAQRAHQAIAGSILRIIPDCGHWPQRERPDIFHALVREFLFPETLP